MDNTCNWNTEDEMYMAYHDEEWGVPVHDDRRLFEFLILEGAQAGLSWLTILRKRAEYERAYDNFDIETVANYTESDVDRLLSNAGIVRNKLKVRSSITNAKAVIEIQKEFGSFSNYLWAFVDNKTVDNHLSSTSDMPITSAISDKMSKDMKKRGFKFVGSTIMYSFMQAVGMVNDHVTTCFRYEQVKHLCL